MERKKKCSGTSIHTRKANIINMWSFLSLLVIVSASSVSGTGVKCDICTTTSIVVENVLLHNATAGYTFQNAAAALCANVPREMRETVRFFLNNIYVVFATFPHVYRIYIYMYI
jgi:hypothetical protein